MRGKSVIARLATSANRRTFRQGYTLLEVLLALALAAMVFLALAMAVDFQLRAVEAGRDGVEEAQLARVLLHRMAADLRGAVPYQAIDYDSLGSTDGSGGESSGTDGMTGEMGEDSGDWDLEDWELEEDEDADAGTETTGEALESGVPQSVPGVYGGTDWIQVDVGRLPRLELNESTAMPVDGAVPATINSGDVRTVAYFVAAADQLGGALAADGSPAAGLVRRESDRAASAYASDQGFLEWNGLASTPLATEVQSIEFSYFDGTDWVDEWDSGEMGGLPFAVEILLTVGPSQQGVDEFSPAADAALPEGDSLVYRLVVDLPAAKASYGEEASGETDEMMGMSDMF
ncbi:MAG: prepilin-type N-terminal cleavage/methylation domain-containing protein [Planctomycetota bacterium]|jgi:prepilin-type N-terminal cleavage/methylation domain-containing protein